MRAYKPRRGTQPGRKASEATGRRRKSPRGRLAPSWARIDGLPEGKSERIVDWLWVRARTAWFSLPEISSYVGCLHTTASAKLRQLRTEPYGGFTVLRRLRAGTRRTYEYRIQ